MCAIFWCNENFDEAGAAYAGKGELQGSSRFNEHEYMRLYVCFSSVQSVMPVGGYQGRDGPVQTGLHEDVFFSDLCPHTWVGKYIARICAHLVVGSTRASVKRKVACFGPWTE